MLYSGVRMKEKIINFLDGKYSLIYSYWIIGTIGSIIVGLPLFITSEVGVDNISEAVSALLLLYILFYAVYVVISLIGIWRSAGFYIIEKIKKKESAFWAYAARTIVVLGWLSLILETFKFFI